MKRGFTLIELLVVVLIIGILAAIALPQYQKAVAKARATEAIVNVPKLAQAMEYYYMVNGEYPTTENLGPVSENEAMQKVLDALDLRFRFTKNFRIVIHGDSYVGFHTINLPQNRGYMISMLLQHRPNQNAGVETWSHVSNSGKLICSIEADNTDPSSPAYRLCSSLCKVNTLGEFKWGSNQLGCFIRG